MRDSEEISMVEYLVNRTLRDEEMSIVVNLHLENYIAKPYKSILLARRVAPDTVK